MITIKTDSMGKIEQGTLMNGGLPTSALLELFIVAHTANKSTSWDDNFNRTAKATVVEKYGLATTPMVMSTAWKRSLKNRASGPNGQGDGIRTTLIPARMLAFQAYTMGVQVL